MDNVEKEASIEAWKAYDVAVQNAWIAYERAIRDAQEDYDAVLDNRPVGPRPD